MEETAATNQAAVATGEAPAAETSRLQRRIGCVVSTHGEKTIRVVIDNLVKHPKYGKFLHRRTKLAVHDPDNAAKLGDIVEIVPCRRISKSKSWRLESVIRRGDVVEPVSTDIAR